MIRVSEEFKTLMQQRTDFKCNAVITFVDGSVIELNESVFTLNNNSITDGADVAGLPLGVAISRTIQLEVLNDKDQYADYDFFGAKIRLYLTFQLSKTVEKIEMGTFTVITPETYGETVIITAQDDMYKADTPYRTTITYPATLSAMFREICDNCGLTFVTAAFTNSTFTVDSAPSGDLTNRQMLGYIAMIAGGNARINRSGSLEIMTYKTVEEANHRVDSFINLNVGVTSISITGLKTTSFAEDYSSAGVTYTYGREGYMLSLENPLFAGKEETALSLIAPYLLNNGIYRFECDVPANPTFEFMDTLIFKDRKRNVYYSSWITYVNFVFGGITTIKNTAEPALRNNANYVAPETQAIIAAKKLVQSEKKARELAVESLNKKLATASGMYSTDEKQPDGSTIHYLHDKPTLTESANVIKVTAEAIGFSTNGGATYPFGIEISGDVIAKILSAEGINADWINVGSLTAKNAAGDTVFEVDVDTGKVVMNGTDGNVNFQNCPFKTSHSKTYYAQDYTDADLERVRQILLGVITPTDEDYERFDFYGDGEITTTDVVVVRNLLLGRYDWLKITWYVEIEPSSKQNVLRVYYTIEDSAEGIRKTTETFSVGAGGITHMTVQTNDMMGGVLAFDSLGKVYGTEGTEFFAPAGYGLGEEVFYANNLGLSELDNLRTTCFFAVSEPSVVTVNNIPFATAMGRNLAFLNGREYQELMMLNSTCKLVRYCWEGAWSAWECENPPMVIGVEYRTTKRFNGKPIYTKLVNLGTMPNASSMSIAHGISNIEDAFVIKGSMKASSNTVSFPYYNADNNFVDLTVQRQVILVVTGGNSSAFTGAVQIEYTKTTD